MASQIVYPVPTRSLEIYLLGCKWTTWTHSGKNASHAPRNIISPPHHHQKRVLKLNKVSLLHGSPSLCIKDAWVKDSGVGISDEWWVKRMTRYQMMGVDRGVHLIQFKVLHSCKSKLSSVSVPVTGARWVMGPRVIFCGPLRSSHVFGTAFFPLIP